MGKIYDSIIIGAGPAGLSASLYASRYKLDHLIFGVESGGQMNEIYAIENWPGDISVSGKELIERMTMHVENYGVKVQHESIISIKKTEDNLFEIESPLATYGAKSLILAMGAQYRKMNIPGEKEFIGKGVSYCATCDAMFFRDKIVAVAGGGNSAAVVALELRDFAGKIYLIHREGKLSAEPVLMDKIKNEKKIEIIDNNDILEIKGSEKVEKIILDKPYNDKTYLDVDGVFIEVGTEPGVQLARKLGIETDDQDYIKVKEDMSTNIPGVFAAGDITTGSNKFRQVLVAAAEGAIAANGAYKFVKLK
jgi:thioredoxin reductase (NADPH)